MMKKITLFIFYLAFMSLKAQVTIPLTNQDCDNGGTLTGTSPFTNVPGFTVTQSTGSTIDPATSGVVSSEFVVNITSSSTSQGDLLFETDKADISSFDTSEVFTFTWQMKTTSLTDKTSPYNIIAKFYDEDDLDVTGSCTFSIIKTKGDYKSGPANTFQTNKIVVAVQPNVNGKNAKYITLQVQLGKLFDGVNTGTGTVIFDSFTLASLPESDPISGNTAIPISYYGSWDRGGAIDDYSDPKYDYILGIEANPHWEEIQPTGPDSFDFSEFQLALDNAYTYNKLVKLSINVGPESPLWIYENGVPLVEGVDENTTEPNWPYYLDEDYKNYYHELIRQFSLFLRNQPDYIFERIAFIQVKTGATGDEAPYKGTPDDSQYLISDQEWEGFRIESFEVFKQYFNDVSDRKVVLLFNNLDPAKYPEAYNWAMTEIDPEIGFGIKGGAYNRGHHLSDEQTFKEQWLPYLVNPKGMKLFSASEMDQSWRKPIFSINTELSFYWAVLSSINTGVSTTNITASAINYIFDHDEIRDIYKLYNKYAQQVYPATATAVMSVLHEGLNSADTNKFPESEYGNATKNNEARYLAICNDPIYQNRGAKMDDVYAATRGQVYQRDAQTGFNDAGWEIAEGNYERFLYQIDADNTSIGLFRVRGEIDENSSKYDRFARAFENSTGKNTMYFKFDDDMFIESLPASLSFTITWLDKNAGSTWALKYKAGTIDKTALEITGQGTNVWKTEKVTINDISVGGTGLNSSDFTLVNTDAVDDIFHGIEIDIERETLSLSLAEETFLNTWILYPNPTNSLVSWNAPGKINKVQVRNITGALVLQANNPTSNTINLESLNNGIYFVEFYQANKKPVVKKLIKY